MGNLTERQEWTLAQLCALPEDRESAAKAGETLYYTGESCKHGHFLSPRLVSTSGCVECKRNSQAKYRKSDKGKSTQRWAFRKVYQRRMELNPDYWRAKDRIKYYQKQLDKNLAELSDLLSKTRS